MDDIYLQWVGGWYSVLAWMASTCNGLAAAICLSMDDIYLQWVGGWQSFLAWMTSTCNGLAAGNLSWHEWFAT
jgi:hypothetical protein